jgi:hypothetical protein
MRLRKRPKWTVILLYPDYCTDDFGGDIYVGWVACNDPHKAAAIAQKKAWKANDGPEGSIDKPEDLRVIAVISGHHKLELDATSFMGKGVKA